MNHRQTVQGSTSFWREREREREREKERTRERKRRRRRREKKRHKVTDDDEVNEGAK